MIAATAKPTIDPAEIKRAFDVFMGPGQVTELRAIDAVLHGDRYTYPIASGYFDNGDALAEAQLGEVRGVLAEGLFGVAAGFAVVPEHPRRALLVQALQVLDAGDDGHDQVLSELVSLSCHFAALGARPLDPQVQSPDVARCRAG